MRLDRKEYLREGRGFVSLGVCMAAAAFLTNIAHLAFMAYLNRSASTEEVGLYQAGSTLIVRYVGLIFSAVGMELFPRLSANQHSRTRLNIFVSHEITLLMTVIIPVILLFLFFRQYIVQILYSEEFLPVIPLISWGILCSIFKGASWCMAFTIIVRGDGGIYVLTEGIDAAVGLILNIVFYNLFGLTGIGIAYILWFISYCLIVGTVYYRRYGLRLSRTALSAVAIATAVCGCALAGIETLHPVVTYVVFPIAIAASFIPAVRLYRH